MLDLLNPVFIKQLTFFDGAVLGYIPTEDELLCAFSGDDLFQTSATGGYDGFDCYELGVIINTLIPIHSGWGSSFIIKHPITGITGVEDFQNYDYTPSGTTLTSLANEGTGFGGGFIFVGNMEYGVSGEEIWNSYDSGAIVSSPSINVTYNDGDGFVSGWVINDNS